MVQTFETMIQTERDRLAKAREDALAKLHEAEAQIAAIDREMSAITAYEQVKAGKTFHPQTERKPRAPSTRAPRGERGKLREQIKELVSQFPDGIDAPGIYQELGASTPHEKRPIDAALNAMKKDGPLFQERRRGPYKLGTSTHG